MPDSVAPPPEGPAHVSSPAPGDLAALSDHELVRLAERLYAEAWEPGFEDYLPVRDEYERRAEAARTAIHALFEAGCERESVEAFGAAFAAYTALPSQMQRYVWWVGRYERETDLTDRHFDPVPDAWLDAAIRRRAAAATREVEA